MLTNEKAASELLSKNLTYIIKNEYPSQKAFAEKMEIAQATLVKILKSGQIPSIYPFFYNLEKETQYTMSVKVKFFAPRQIQRRLFAALITLSRKVF